MKSFLEWINEQGFQMKPPPIPSLPKKINHQDSEAEGLWKANSPLTRLGYLYGFPKAKELNLHNMDWNDLPSDAQQHTIRSMGERGPFKII